MSYLTVRFSPLLNNQEGANTAYCSDHHNNSDNNCNDSPGVAALGHDNLLDYLLTLSRLLIINRLLLNRGILSFYIGVEAFFPIVVEIRILEIIGIIVKVVIFFARICVGVIVILAGVIGIFLSAVFLGFILELTCYPGRPILPNGSVLGGKGPLIRAFNLNVGRIKGS